MDFVVCFGLLSCCITKMHSSFRAKGMDTHFPFQDFLVEQNSQFHELQQVVQLPKQQNSPRPSWPSSSLLVWCSHYGTLVYTLHGRCNATQTFHKIVYFSCHSTECFPKSLRDHQDFFFFKCETLCSFWSAVIVHWNSLMDATSVQSLSYCWNMNSDLN